MTVVGYRTPMGDVEYMEMDVALEEGERDDRFLAFEVNACIHYKLHAPFFLFFHIYM